ncbi:MAG: formamidopyrimidine-DNA glycosylase [Planctomycetota bacterium]|jgi:formamidopyrimidine-DNA glycosylase
MIRPHLVGRRIAGTEVDWERTLGGQGPDDFRRVVTGARIAAVSRRAKYIRIDLTRRGKPAGSVVVHLRMTGRLMVDPLEDPTPDYRRVSLRLDNEVPGRGVLHFVDVRKFGRFTFHANADEALAHLGPEPLEDDFTAEWLRQALGSRQRAVKPLLLDQAFLAGLGNIYVDESLFLAGVHPQRRSDRIPKDRVVRLHEAIQAILRQAIEREGSSFDSFYRTPEGQPGSYQHQFRVYGREGRPCRTCERPIVRIVVGQRGTHFCSRCQPVPRARK